MIFSEREGFKPVREIIQIDSASPELRNRLWNVLTTFVWQRADKGNNWHYSDVHPLITILWDVYFKRPYDTIPNHWAQVYKHIREHCVDGAWYNIYDVMEFIANNYDDSRTYPRPLPIYIAVCNGVLAEDLSGWRFIDHILTRITNADEVAAIQNAIDMAGPLKPISDHIKNAVRLLSQRPTPDCPNSIKESISAVEAACGLINGETSSGLAGAFSTMNKKHSIVFHQALRQGFERLYRWTSDAHGIRHAKLDDSKVSIDDGGIWQFPVPLLRIISSPARQKPGYLLNRT